MRISLRHILFISGTIPLLHTHVILSLSQSQLSKLFGIHLNIFPLNPIDIKNRDSGKFILRFDLDLRVYM